jgi:hypothetical protein
MGVSLPSVLCAKINVDGAPSPALFAGNLPRIAKGDPFQPTPQGVDDGDNELSPAGRHSLEDLLQIVDKMIWIKILVEPQ